MAYRTVDAARLHTLGELPRLPSESARRGLKPGDRVGVLVQSGADRETAYVHVISASNGRYSGAPENPADVGGQTRLAFGPNNVVDVPGAVSRTMVGAAMIAAGLAGLWWESRSTAKATETAAAAEAERARLAAAAAPAAALGAGAAQGAAQTPAPGAAKPSDGFMGSYAGSGF